jgi:hypothetical protein
MSPASPQQPSAVSRPVRRGARPAAPRARAPSRRRGHHGEPEGPARGGRVLRLRPGPRDAGPVRPLLQARGGLHAAPAGLPRVGAPHVRARFQRRPRGGPPCSPRAALHRRDRRLRRHRRGRLRPCLRRAGVRDRQVGRPGGRLLRASTAAEARAVEEVEPARRRSEGRSHAGAASLRLGPTGDARALPDRRSRGPGQRRAPPTRASRAPPTCHQRSLSASSAFALGAERPPRAARAPPRPRPRRSSSSAAASVFLDSSSPRRTRAASDCPCTVACDSSSSPASARRRRRGPSGERHARSGGGSGSSSAGALCRHHFDDCGFHDWGSVPTYLTAPYSSTTIVVRSAPPRTPRNAQTSHHAPHVKAPARRGRCSRCKGPAPPRGPRGSRSGQSAARGCPAVPAETVWAAVTSLA